MASSIIPIGAEHSVALYTPVRKRAELDGELEQHQGQIRDLQKAIQNLDAVLMLLKQDIDISEIAAKRVRPPFAAAAGEITGIVVDCLREVEGPLTSRALARAVVETRDIDPADVKLEVTMAKRVRACLRPLRLAGRVRAVPMQMGPQGWILETKQAGQVSIVSVGQAQ